MEFYLRQVLSSANYRTGGDANDFAHGFLNYQTEHHCWPTLSMRSYQRGAPLLREICARHGVPYTQESVWERTRKTVSVMVGASSMRLWPGLPNPELPNPELPNPECRPQEQTDEPVEIVRA
jgi:fatty acid desaturase